MSADEKADVVIIGAGPVGLFAVFQLGLYDIHCHLIDSLDRPGGQCAEFYADKPIYDVPGYPSILAQELIDRLLEQVSPFKPQFSFGQQVVDVEPIADQGFRVSTHKGQVIDTKFVVIAGGWGPIWPQDQPPGDSAKPDPTSDWGVALHDGSVVADTEKFETSLPGIFAIGDACMYPGKVRLLLSGFHEAALMAQAVRRLLQPPKRETQLYTSSSSKLQKKLGVIE